MGPDRTTHAIDYSAPRCARGTVLTVPPAPEFGRMSRRKIASTALAQHDAIMRLTAQVLDAERRAAERAYLAGRERISREQSETLVDHLADTARRLTEQRDRAAALAETAVRIHIPVGVLSRTESTADAVETIVRERDEYRRERDAARIERNDALAERDEARQEVADVRARLRQVGEERDEALKRADAAERALCIAAGPNAVRRLHGLPAATVRVDVTPTATPALLKALDESIESAEQFAGALDAARVALRGA